MAENGEAARANIDTNQQEIQQAKEAIDKLVIKNDQDKRQYEKKIKEELQKNENKALELNQFKKNLPEKQIKEAKSVKIALVKTLRAVEKDIITPPTNSSRFFKNLASQRISDKLTDSSASSVFTLVSNFLDRDLTLSDIKQGFSNLKNSGLNESDPGLFYPLTEALRTTAEEMGMPEEQALNFFNLNKDEEINSLIKEQNELTRKSKFDADWDYHRMSTFFNESQKHVIRALNSAQDFAEFVLNEGQEFALKNGLLELKREHYQQISEEIRKKIIIVFGNIYSSVNESSVKKFFEQIVQAGFMDSPQTVETNLTRKLETLISGFRSDSGSFPKELKESIDNFEFYIEEFVNKDVDRIKEFEDNARDESGKILKNEKGEILKKPRKKVITVREPIPLTKSKNCSMNDFIRSILVEVGHEIEWTEYLHNISTLMTQSSGKEGFWPTIAGYADKMGATDLDAIMSLPDAEVINAAYRLYTKYLQGEFAKFNWVHQPNMFGTDAQSNRTPLQLKIMRDLKLMFPDLKLEDHRIARAMNMGLGLARGVFLTEQELAAWADPSVKLADGTATYRSYYTNDNAALNALNPLHTFLRWQSESSMRGPLLMALVSGIETKLFNSYNHKILFDNAQKWLDAWNKGELAFDRKNPKERTLVEILLNISRVGSLVSRGGWSLLPEIEGLFVWNNVEKKVNGEIVKERNETDINKYQSFKSIEYVGFDALFAFVNDQVLTDAYLVPNNTLLLLNGAKGNNTTSKIEDFFKKAKDIAVEAERENKLSDRDKLLKHIYNKYFPEGGNKSVGEVYDKLGEYIAGAKDEIDALMRQGKLANADIVTPIDKKDYYINSREKAIISEVYKRLICRGMAGLLQDRLPSKFVTLERSRTSKNGTRLWEEIALDLQRDEEESKNLITSEIMDLRLQDLMLVETRLRQKTTQQMKEYQKTIYIENNRIDFSDFEAEVKPSFKVTEESIREQLTEVLGSGKNLSEADQKRIDNTISLFRLINKHCAKEKYLCDFGEKIRPNDALNKLKDKYFPFSIAPEELENSFLAWRASGEKVLKRRIGDIGGAETEVFIGLDTYLKALNTVATDGKHDYKPLVDAIGKVSSYLVNIIGKDYGQKVAHDLAMMTMTYFRKDSIADTWITTLFRVGRKNSLAAEFAGPGIPVWEWGRKDNDGFANALAAAGALPRDPYDLSKVPAYERRVVKLFGKKIFEYNVQKPDVEYCGNKLRSSIGAQMKQMFFLEFGGTAMPLIFFLFLLFALKKGFAEMSGSNK